MSAEKAAILAGSKRKRESSKADRKLKAKKRRASSSDDEDEDTQVTIQQLEAQILESRRHFNNIGTLLQRARQRNGREKAAILSAVSLCRVFSRLLATGDMGKSKGMPQSEVILVQWLKERYKEFLDVLLDQYLCGDVASKQSVALTLLMRLAKEESKAQKDYNWKHGPLPRVIETVLTLPENCAVHTEFAEGYFKRFDDMRLFTFLCIKDTFKSDAHDNNVALLATNSLSLLMSLEQVHTSSDDKNYFLAGIPKQSKNSSTYKAHAQEAWLATMRSGLTKDQRKAVLSVFSYQIAPWFHQPEILMDFLTDSYNEGGGTSLLALSGLYYLMSERNLDYPSFFPKLYSLLDEGLLHSKYRSRFFRLLDTFMASTHLPAILVASFIKKLSRLALSAPPAGIVVVIPWIYNMFKRHPACTFMIHREVHDLESRARLEEEGLEDPFDMEERDPMLTDAIESSLWEIESLQSHYHPNVATLATIISEQFTKQSYNLEDFLDHSYNALLDTELGRDLKKEPVVEFEIPKRIFTTQEADLGTLGQLLIRVTELNS